MSDNKPSVTQRYLKGAFSPVKNHMDFWESAGWDDANKRKADTPSGETFVEILLVSRKAKPGLSGAPLPFLYLQ